MDEGEVFTTGQRTRVFEHVLALAKADCCVSAGAVIGSLAGNEGDRWSDLDLTFAVTSGGEVAPVLDRLTEALATEFGAARLFDLPYDGVLYRVLLLRGALQVGLSATPEDKFGERGPNFKLLFGHAAEQLTIRTTVPSLGYAVHHALRARFSIERGRFWQAEFWIGECRNVALGLACARYGLVGAYGRGFDQLPPELLAQAQAGLVGSLDVHSLLSALRGVVQLLLREAAYKADFSPVLEEHLLLLTRSWPATA